MAIWDVLARFSKKTGSYHFRRSRRKHASIRKVGKQRGLRFERFEDRLLLSASPQLIAVIPNQGNTLSEGAVLQLHRSNSSSGSMKGNRSIRPRWRAITMPAPVATA